MPTWESYHFDLTIPPANHQAVLETLDEEGKTRVGDLAERASECLNDWLARINEAEAPDPVFLDDEGNIIVQASVHDEQFYSEKDRVRIITALSTKGSNTTIVFDDDGGGEYKLIAKGNGGVSKHRPTTIYLSLPHTITSELALKMVAALAAREEQR